MRIGGGVFPEIREADFLTPGGGYSIGPDAAPAMLDSLMYKLSYHEFDQARTACCCACMAGRGGACGTRSPPPALPRFLPLVFFCARSHYGYVVAARALTPNPPPDASPTPQNPPTPKTPPRQVMLEQGRPAGYDRVRHVEIGRKGEALELEALEQAFTSEHWIVRIYKVLPDTNRG